MDLRILACSLVSFWMGHPPTLAAEPMKPRAAWEAHDARIVAFSPDGASLVTFAKGEGLHLRSTSTGKVRFTLALDYNNIDIPIFSPDSRLLFARVSSDRHKPIHVFDLKVWDVEKGEVLATLPYVSEAVYSEMADFSLSPDGTVLAVLDNNERLPPVITKSKMQMFNREFETISNTSRGLPRVRLWNVATRKDVAALDGGPPMVFSPDSKTLVTRSRDWHVPTARVWDLKTHTLKRELEGRAPAMKPMAFSPNGNLLAIPGHSEQMLWDLSTGKKWPIPVKNNSSTPVFSKDGTLLFPDGLPHGEPTHNMGREYTCYDISTLPPTRLEIAEGQISGQGSTYYEKPRLLISLSAMRFLAFGAQDENERRRVEIRSLPTLRYHGRFAVYGLVKAGLSPDGRRLVTWCWINIPGIDNQQGQRKQQMQVIDTQTGRLVAIIPLREPICFDASWQISPDGKTLAVVYLVGKNTDPGISEQAARVELWDMP